jgi:hypothetical protein
MAFGQGERAEKTESAVLKERAGEIESTVARKRAKQQESTALSERAVIAERYRRAEASRGFGVLR